MRVRDFMKKDLITVDTETPIMAALDTMKQNHIKRLPVTKGDKFVGLVTRAMIRDASPSDATSLSVYELNYLISKMKVKDIMVKDPVTISPDMPVEEAIWMGKEKGIGAFPVVEKGKLIGIITESDISGIVSRALGLGEKGSKRITIATSGNRYGYLSNLVEVLDSYEIPILSILSIPKEGSEEWYLIIRIKADDANKAAEDLKAKGYKVIEVT